MQNRIKSRLADLLKTQVDLMEELEKQGYLVDKSSLSLAIRGRRKTDGAKKILMACDEIITKWESEAKECSKN